MYQQAQVHYLHGPFPPDLTLPERVLKGWTEFIRISFYQMQVNLSDVTLVKQHLEQQSGKGSTILKFIIWVTCPICINISNVNGTYIKKRMH